MDIPSGYTYLSSPSADSAKYVWDDSTQTLRQDFTVSRKAPTHNPNTKVFSVPEYRIAIRSDVPDAEGGPTGQRATVDLTLRYPVGLSAAKLAELRDDLVSVITQEDFIADAVKQLFPMKP